MRSEDIAAVEAILGYTFRDPSLLECAMTHRSYANEHVCASNGRLEYLGDSVLNMIVAEHLYRTCKEEEGILTDLRQHIVSETPLADAVRAMGIFSYYRLGKGAQKCKDAFGEKPTSDIFESLLGAVYLDGGIAPARAFVERHLLSRERTDDPL